MNLSLLTLFREAATAKSFAAAARAMDTDPSAVSRAIAALEAELGSRLFERSTRSVSLTEAGALFLERIGPILDDLAEAREAARDLSQAARGTLRVTASTAFGEHCILPMLKSFLADNPDVTVELLLTDRFVDLVAERIDVAIRMTPEAPPDILVSRLMTTRYMVVASPEWLDRHQVRHPSELADVECVVFPYPGYRDLWRFRNTVGEFEVHVHARLQIMGAGAVLRAAEKGLGPALLADWAILEALRDRRLIDMFPDYEVTATSFDTAAWLLMPSRQYRPLRTKLFLTALRTALSQ